MFSYIDISLTRRIKTCKSALTLFKTPEQKAEFSAACQTRFPLSTIFKTPEEKARLRSEADQHDKPNGDAEEIVA